MSAEDEHDKITANNEIVEVSSSEIEKPTTRIIEIKCAKCGKVVGQIELPAHVQKDPPHPILCADCALLPPAAEETKVFEDDEHKDQ